MLTQKTLVDQIEKTANGLGIRLELCVFNDDVKISSRWHRTMVDDTVDPVQQMEFVNMHLAAMGEEPVDIEDIDDIRLFNELRMDLKTQKTKATRVLGKPLADSITKAATVRASAVKK